MSRATDINTNGHRALFSFESCLHCCERTHLSGKMKQFESIKKLPNCRKTSYFLKEVKKRGFRNVGMTCTSCQMELGQRAPGHHPLPQGLWTPKPLPQMSTRPSEDAHFLLPLPLHSHSAGPRLDRD